VSFGAAAVLVIVTLHGGVITFPVLLVYLVVVIGIGTCSFVLHGDGGSFYCKEV